MTRLSRRAPFLLAALLAATAFADVRIYPTRVLVDSKSRSASVAVTNHGTKLEVYEVVPRFFRLQQGKLVPADKPELAERSLLPYLKFSPKRFELKPGQEQVVRVRVFPGAGMGDGEYRAHLSFQPVDRPKAAAEQLGKAAPEPAKDTSPAFRMSLEARLAISIPVYFKQGTVTKAASLAELAWKNVDGRPFLELDLATEGNGFLYGDVLVYEGTRAEPDRLVTKLGGVGTFQKKERLSLPLVPMNKASEIPPLEKLRKGTYLVEYRSPEEEGGKVYATEKLAPAAR